ncbi:unnamed protein product [Diplocarpon coronariae]
MLAPTIFPGLPLALLLLHHSSQGHATKFQEYILAPSCRRITPSAIFAVAGKVENPNALLADVRSSAGSVFSGANSSVTVDFGRNIAGTVEFDVRSVWGSDEYLGFTFTESSTYISPYYCDATADDVALEGPLWFRIHSKGRYTAEKKHQRGGFRYMSIWHNSTGAVRIGDLSVNFTASPAMDDLRDYRGFFNSDSEKLNRVWYAGAYTNQLCTIDPAYGNAFGAPADEWYYNSSIANGTAVLADGAKRDRLVAPGDLVISGPSTMVSTNRLDGVRNAIDALFTLQQADGRLSWAGPPFARFLGLDFVFSFTYHLLTLLDVYDYYLYSGDLDYLTSHWPQYKLALAWSLDTIDDSAMAYVSSPNDWLRRGMGGHNIEANSILYRTLAVSLELADAVGDTAHRRRWTSAMAGIKAAANARLWDPAQNLYRDNDTGTSLHPQDGNAWAVVSGIADAARAAAVSTALRSRWIRPYGAPAPEAAGIISPYASGFELQAHYLAGFPQRAVELMEFMWADFMLDDPRMTNSTLVEGYSTDGSLRYLYAHDARVSHAHGWATAPTATLTFLGAGVQLLTAAGATWRVQPRLGGLKRVTAGYETPLGRFAAEWRAAGDGDGGDGDGGLVGSFETPEGTAGTLVLPAGDVRPVVTGPRGLEHPSGADVGTGTGTGPGTWTFTGLPGGSYAVRPGAGRLAR